MPNNMEKIKFIKYPTPIQYLENVSKDYGCNIYVKRDDLVGVGLGGNKVRKLEYLLADAKNKNCKLIVGSGSLQTNCGMLTALCAKQLDMSAVLFLLIEDEVDSKILSGNLILNDYIGCDIEFVDVVDIMLDPVLSVAEKDDLSAKRLQEKMDKCIPLYQEKYGVSKEEIYRIVSAGSTPLGTLGYVDCIQEIVQQSDVKYDYIFCGNGSGGTYAGMWLGAEIYMPETKVIGVNIEDMNPGKPDFIVNLIKDAADILNISTNIKREGLKFLAHSVNKGYAIPDDETMGVIEYFAQKEGFFLDPVYTAKIFNGALKEIKYLTLSPGCNILFLHSGGLPGIYNENMISYRGDSSSLLKRWRDDSN